MIRINVLHGIKRPLPPATPREVVEVCLLALLFVCLVALTVFGAVMLLGHLLNGN
jgi:hypothetical protein